MTDAMWQALKEQLGRIEKRLEAIEKNTQEFDPSPSTQAFKWKDGQFVPDLRPGDLNLVE